MAERWSFVPDVLLRTVGTRSTQRWLAQHLEPFGIPRDQLLRLDDDRSYAVGVPGRGLDLTLQKTAAITEAGAPAESWWHLCGFTLHVPDPLGPADAGWRGGWPAGLPAQTHCARLSDLEAAFGPAEMAAGMLVYFVLPAPSIRIHHHPSPAEDVDHLAMEAAQWTVQCVTDRHTQTLRSLTVMAVGESCAVSVLPPRSSEAQRTRSAPVQCVSGDLVPWTGVWELSLPSTHPTARHLHAHPQRFVHRERGQTIQSGGLLEAHDEIFAVWTWRGD